MFFLCFFNKNEIMIIYFKVTNLNGKGENGNFEFHCHEDLNIFTGQNGCGKTTLLKLLQYVYSDNLKNLVL